jgi:hypothetical protein
MLNGRFLFALLILTPLAAHAAIGCHGQAFGATTKRFIDREPANLFYAGIPAGVAIPAHIVAVSFENWGCGTSLSVDLDSGRVWKRLRCASEDAFDRDVGMSSWTGAHIGSYTNFNRQPAREAVKEGRLPAAAIEELVCLANDAWRAGRWGQVPTFDAEGAMIEAAPPYPASPHGFSAILLKDGDTTRTLGMYYHPSGDNPDGKLERSIEEHLGATFP